MDKEAIEKVAKDTEYAKAKGFDSVIDWYLACLNAEVNILLDPKLITKDRLDTLAVKTKEYIEKIFKAISGYRKLPPEWLPEIDRIVAQYEGNKNDPRITNQNL